MALKWVLSLCCTASSTNSLGVEGVETNDKAFRLSLRNIGAECG